MNMGKCGNCGKTVYQSECMSACEKVFHKPCFKCSVCNWKLEYHNLKTWDGKLYCSHHFPVTGSGEHRTHGTVGTDAYAAPKSPRGDDFVVKANILSPRGAQSSNYGADAVTMQTAANAPKADVEKGIARGGTQ